MESKDFEAASALAAKLGDKTAISNISFLLSREGREAEERKLLSQAAQAFKERALAAANASGSRVIACPSWSWAAAARRPRCRA